MNTSSFDLNDGDKTPKPSRFGRVGLAIVALLTLGFISALAFEAPSRWLFGSIGAESAVEEKDADVVSPRADASPDPTPEPTPDELRMKVGPSKVRLSYEYWGPFDYDIFLEREKAGEFPSQAGDVYGDSPYNFLVNNDGGNTGTCCFTQSETSLTAFGNTVVVGFNDSGSNSGGTNKFTGFARSTDGGATFTDGGTLPTSVVGDAGDPVLARDNVTGRIYLSTLGFSGAGTIQMWRSDDNGATWQAPINATPGGSSEDKQWHTVDNFPGAGQGNVYMLSRRFGTGPGIYFFRSTDGGATFGPNLGTLIVTGSQGAFIAVGPDHSIYAFWYAGTTLQMRKSTDLGATFAAPVTVATGLVGGTNGDLALTGRRNGTTTFSGFRSNEFPHVAVNPVSGHIYTVFANNPAGVDKADIFFVQSTDGGATWSPAVRVNDDATTTDQWQPTIAVSTAGDRVGFFYYSRQEDPVDNNLFKFWGRIGSISGAAVTLQPSFAVSDEASLPEFGRDSIVNSVYMGDYDHAVATPGFFHVTWSDSRGANLPTGGDRKNPNIYYKKIPLGLAVSTTVPAINSILSTTPTSFVVNFTDAIDATTVSASDFTVNGIAASSFVVNDADTVTFSYGASPVTAQGIQTMAMAAGSVTRLSDGSPLLEFTGTFRYDATPLNVISTSPPFPGGVFTLPGPFTYDVTFNEPINPASVSTSDLTLSGIAGATVTGVSVLPGNTTARFTINVATEGTLTAAISAGAVTDAFGNPGNAFSANYGVDIGTVPYPALAAKEPIGSLIYDPLALGTINFAGDADNFTIDLDPNQNISIIVRPTSASLQPRVELFDPGNVSLGFASAGAPNQPTGIQTRAITAPGTYTIQVSSVGATTGNYSVQVILNAAFELEGLIPGSNNTAATAQNINGSFLDLSTSIGTAKRGAVNGTSDSANYTAAAAPFGFEDIAATGTPIAALNNVDDVSTSVPIGFSFPLYGGSNTSVFVSSNGLLTFGGADTSFTNADLTTAPNLAGIAVLWDDQHTGGGVAGSGVLTQRLDAGGPNDRFIIQWNNVRFFSGGTAGDTITYQAVLFADGRVRVNYADIVSGTAGGNNGASSSVGLKAAGAQGANRLLLAFNNGPNAFVGTGQSTLISPPSPTPDYYSFTAAAGDVVTVGAKALGLTGVSVQLVGPDGVTVLATGVGATNLTSVVNNVAVPSAGTYFVRVSAPAGVPYNVVVTRNAAFDTEPNESFATPQTLDGNRSALGAIIGVAEYVATNPSPGFEDISGTGSRIAALNDADDAVASVPIGFSFPFYGAGNTDVFVSTNGLLTFGSGNTGFTNTDLTTTPTQPTIAAFWDDQHTGGGTAASGVYTQVSGVGNDQHLTIQWHQVRFFAGGTAGDTITYQAQLYADGRILLNYLDLASGTAAGNNGATATVGVKASGAQGPNRLLLAFNNGPNSFVGTGVSTLVAQPPGQDWYSFVVGSNQNLVEIETSTPGDGPGEFVNNLDPGIELYDPSGALVASGTALADGRNESIVVSGPVAGTYRVRVNGDNSTVGEYFLSTRVRTETTETLTVAPNPVQYSDLATFTATISPSVANGEAPATEVTFLVDGNPIGTVPLTESGGVLTGTLSNYQVLLPQGSYTVVADFNATDPDFVVEDPTATLVVNLEDTNVVLSQPYVFAVQVNTPGGTAGPITRCINITDTDSSLGDIDLAQPVTVTVTPVVAGPAPTQSAVTYDANTADNTLTACVTFTNVAVNAYDVRFTIGGNYYQGSFDYELIVVDPKRGFTTGGGQVNNPNTNRSMTFGFVSSYLRRKLLAQLVLSESGFFFKSNRALAMAVVGKTAIVYGEGSLNGAGGHAFRLIVTDNGEPGRNDRLGIRIRNPAGALVTNYSFAPKTIARGNIQLHGDCDDHNHDSDLHSQGVSIEEKGTEPEKE